MKTDNLINAIAQDAASRSPSLAARLAAALAIGGFTALTLFAYGLGMRPDLADAVQTWRFDAKLAITLLCLAAALWATTRLARPDADRRKTLGVLSLPLLALAVAVSAELITSPAQIWSALAVGSNSRLCLASIAILSVAPLATLLIALRAGAPQSPALAGAVAGLLAGALAATLYAIHCTDDSPLFLALWYTAALGLMTVVGTAAGHRVLRW